MLVSPRVVLFAIIPETAKEHAEVQSVANSGIWTQAVKDAWAAKLASLEE